MTWATLAINKIFHCINQEHYCYRLGYYHYTHGCATSKACQCRSDGSRQHNRETSLRAAHPCAVDATPPKYPHIRERNITLWTARSVRATAGAWERAAAKSGVRIRVSLWCPLAYIAPWGAPRWAPLGRPLMGFSDEVH